MKTPRFPFFKLDNGRGIFFQIGLIVALTLTFLAFEWKTLNTANVFVMPTVESGFDEELPELIVEKKKEEKKKPQPRSDFKQTNEEVDHDQEIFDPEADESSTNDTYVPPIKEPEEAIIQIEEPPVYIAEEMPVFPGGENARVLFLSKNIVYPQIAREVDITGIVVLAFIVEKDGSLSNIRILKDIGGGCGTEALRVTKLMPNWKPGKHNGREVRVHCSMPVNFRLK